MNSFNPEAAFLGKLTSCCQNLGDAGEECVIYGITKPNSGFYVLYKKIHEKEDKIVAQCWVWRKDNQIEFDSIEGQLDFRNKNELLISDFYMCLAIKLEKQNGISKVLCGLGGNTPKCFKNMLKPISKIYPPNYFDYRDSEQQCLLACSKLPLFLIYKAQNPNSLITVKLEKLNKNNLEMWCDLCIVNNKKEYIKLIMPSLQKIGLSTRFFNKRIALIKKWQDYLSRKIRIGKAVKFFVEAISFFSHHPNQLKKARPILAKNWENQRNLNFERKISLDEIVNFYRQNIDFNISGKNHPATILTYAAIAGNVNMIEWLIEHGADINAIDNDNKSVLYYVLFFSDKKIAIMQWLFEHGADLNARIDNDKTALHLLVEQSENYDAEIKWLVEHGADINATTKGKNSVLHVASDRGKWELVKWLIERGADINAKNKENITALFIAAARFADRKGFSWENVKWLIVHGAEINIKTNYGETILCRLAYKNKWDKVKWLVEQYGTDVNARKIGEDTILHYAAESTTEDTIIWLIKHGAHVNEKGHYDRTALFVARDANIIECLIKNGAEINIKNYGFGMTPLHCAALKGRLDIFNKLMEYGADIKLRANMGKTVLHFAVHGGNLDIVKSLVEQHKIDLNIKDDGDNMAIDIAIKEDKCNIVNYLTHIQNEQTAKSFMTYSHRKL